MAGIVQTDGIVQSSVSTRLNAPPLVLRIAAAGRLMV